MLLIWASGLNPEVHPLRELHEALSAIGKKTAAGNTLFITLCISSFMSILQNILLQKKILFQMKEGEPPGPNFDDFLKEIRKFSI